MIQPHLTSVVDLGALSRNVATIKSHVAGPEVMAVVKADGYGHGLLASARASIAGGASWLGVALIQEALEIRQANIDTRILAWLFTPQDQLVQAIKADIDLAVNSVWSVEQIAQAAKQAGQIARVHIKIDTGLSRNGVLTTDLAEVLRAISSPVNSANLNVTGVMSHFAYADEPNHPTVAKQLDEFTQAVDLVRASGFEPEVIHLANSAAIFGLPQTHFNLVRPGLTIYGVSPTPHLGSSAELGITPVMSLRAPIALVKDLPAGSGISYAHQYVTEKATRVALIPAGYSDGIPRAGSNVGPVLIAGSLLKIAGRVCMDQFVLDVGDLPVSIGDEVVIFGDPAKGEPSVDDWATATTTINYEILTRLGPRINRTFVNESR